MAVSESTSGLSESESTSRRWPLAHATERQGRIKSLRERLRERVIGGDAKKQRQRKRRKEAEAEEDMRVKSQNNS